MLMVLYLLMGQSVTYQWYAHAAFLLAFTYCLNNTLIIISAMASPSTQHHLPLTLYVRICVLYAVHAAVHAPSVLLCRVHLLSYLLSSKKKSRNIFCLQLSVFNKFS